MDDVTEAISNSAGVFADPIIAVQEERRQAYIRTADPLYFKWQAGEATEQEWLDARAAVIEQYPYPEEVVTDDA